MSISRGCLERRTHQSYKVRDASHCEIVTAAHWSKVES